MSTALASSREHRAPGTKGRWNGARLPLYGVMDDTALPSAAVLPAQLLEPRRVRTAEERLVAALLEDAVRCFRHGPSRTDSRVTRAFREAAHWLRAPDTGPFSCAHACDVLGIDADALRRRLGITIDDTPTGQAPSGRSPSPLARATGT